MTNRELESLSCPTIASVEITRQWTAAQGAFEQSPRVMATLSDGHTLELFSFADERIFRRRVRRLTRPGRLLKFARHRRPVSEHGDLQRRSGSEYETG